MGWDVKRRREDECEWSCRRSEGFWKGFERRLRLGGRKEVKRGSGGRRLGDGRRRERGEGSAERKEHPELNVPSLNILRHVQNHTSS